MQNRKKITSRAKPNKRRQPDNVLVLEFRREYEQKQAELIKRLLLTDMPRIKRSYMLNMPSINF
jgi:hypothetical protein